mmetsp:Transcript_10023/g.22490  ORF Transcript_10023/g.22490 Transcript_10023/m.22490 type:complete len:1179 (-) Transcript_10023:11-3547(-)
MPRVVPISAETEARIAEGGAAVGHVTSKPSRAESSVSVDEVAKTPKSGALADEERSLQTVPGAIALEEGREAAGAQVAEPARSRSNHRSSGGPKAGSSSSSLSPPFSSQQAGALAAGPRISEEIREEERISTIDSLKRETKQAIDCQPPSMSAINQLANVLKGQFGDDLGDPQAQKDGEGDGTADDGEAPSGEPGQQSKPNRTSARYGAQMNSELAANEGTTVAVCSRIVENRLFQGFFMTLTFYALFVPDLDNLFGNPRSKYVLSIITTGVLFLFIIEIVMHCIGRKNYVFRAYFWLDIVASLSLLPDTYFAQTLLGNSFAAGRTTRLTRFIRVASRSSKATRLNRLMRIVRVASLMPKVGALFGRGVRDEDTDKVVDKRLRRVFTFLDEDLDGAIPRSAAIKCAKQFRDAQDRKAQDGKWGITSFLKTRAGSTIGFQTPKSTEANKSLGDTRATLGEPAPGNDDLANSRTPRSGEKTKTTRSNQGPRQGDTQQATDEVTPADPDADLPKVTRTLSRNSGKSEDLPDVGPRSTNQTSNGGDLSPQSPLVTKTKSGKPTVFTGFTGRSKRTMPDDELEDMTTLNGEADVLVSFDEFKGIMLQDPETQLQIRAACRKQLLQSNNMKNMSSRHAEFIAVKVALGVLLLLFVLGIVEPTLQDLSSEKGLEHLDELVDIRVPSRVMGTSIPELVQDQVQVWSSGVGGSNRRLVYLDLRHQIYCSQFEFEGHWCGEATLWGERRGSLTDIDEAVEKSDYRVMDLKLILQPDLKDQDLNDEERNAMTNTVAVINIRSQVQEIALMSILTTLLVIAIILSGICLLTRDLTFVSRNLLRPLRELADDMESIAQLQLAGVAEVDDESYVNHGTNEVRLIRRTFENMKKAIKSWGKYVPWPVVQMMLRANVEANLEVNEMEVTIFFSDIANFTTIVESLPPENSLLLLSRYFNDMSKVIDDHGGVVLEFIGDAILCIYGAPLNNPEHPSAAVRAGLKMMASLKKMNEWSRQRDLPEVKIRCGIHTGQVLVGNMGFHSRMKYGIVGEEAHIPSKLEELNKNYSTGMLISSHTLAKIGPDFVTRPIDVIYIKKAPGGEMVHEVIAREKRRERTHAMWPVVSVHTEAMDLYLARQFLEAAKKFEEVNSMVKEISGEEDQPALVLLKRCRSYAENPPPPEWEGVWDRGEEKS